ncbi:UNVERIFIED_CONTAM: tyrosine-type recombinase/integrase [Kocuria sp. CPCC 205295]|uniref:tyrosine-type recombinase/integrase n=1 Tax=Kocuria TaxID=57493 RepID=UPI00242FFC44|nr:tyrosine-type recombinase/integrase [Kocuria palustris]
MSMRAVAAAVAPESIDEKDEAGLPGALAQLQEVAEDLSEHTLSAATLRAYDRAWRSFEGFTDQHGLDALPAHPQTVGWYVAWLAQQTHDDGTPARGVSSVRQDLAGIAHVHLRAGLLDPTAHQSVRDLVRGLSRLRAARPAQRRALLRDDVLRVIAAMEHDVYPIGVSAHRDTLALWLGFAGALRRSEAAGLHLSQLHLDDHDGVHVRVGKSKADQENQHPDIVVLPYGTKAVSCPVCALHRWVQLLSLSQQPDASARRQSMMKALYSYQDREHVCGAEGGPGLITSADLTEPRPLLPATYRNRHDARVHDRAVSGDALHTMLRTRLAAAGIDPRPYGFHSLRAGHVTQARRGGADTAEIMRAGRWQRAATVELYDREHSPAERNSVHSLGL